MVLVLFAILSIAYSAVPQRMTDDEKLQWALEATNQYCIGVKAEYMPKYGGIGLIATKDIQFKQEYCEIPWKYVLNSYDDYEWADEFKDASTRVRLVARLVYFKFISDDKDDFRWKYVNSNAEEFNGSINWTDSEIENLRKWSGLADLLRQKYDNYNNDWYVYLDKIKKVAPLCSACATKDSYTWGYMMTTSRSFVYAAHTQKYMTHQTDIPADDTNPDKGYAMYPVIDLVNHASFFETKSYKRPIGTLYHRNPYPRFTILAQEYTKAGEEVFFDYGGKGNSDLLYAHGFVFLKNLNEQFQIHAKNPEKKCPKEATDYSGGCWFRLYPHILNKPLFNYLSNVQMTGKFKETHLKGLLKYRSLVHKYIAAHGGLPMREAQRLKTVEDNNRHKLALDYAIGLRLSIYHHKGVIEKAMIDTNLRHLELY